MPGRKSIVGDPYEVCGSLQKMAQEYRVSEFIVVTSIPVYEKRLRSYELLAKSVLGTRNHM